MHPPIAFWFEFGSNYSYLSLMRIAALAARARVPLRYEPFLLGPIFRELGWRSSPFVEQHLKGKYVWRDMARRAAKYGMPFTRPSAFPRRALLPMRVAAMNADQVWIGAFCRRIMLRNWADDVEIDDADVVLAALAGLVADPPAALAQAGTQAAKDMLRAQTERARGLGIFGAPTFIVEGEMFWGDDRLEDALDHAQSLQRA